jgi:ATP-dependent exoDNAse (exonuclease V) beta subunit
MSANGNAVQIMTIHKSKGLEFPVVIYPEAIIDLDEKLNASKSAEEWLRPEDLGFEAIPNLDKVLFKLDSKAESMGEKALDKVEKEKDSNRLDNLNLLYVAFTRAVQRLYVLAKQGKADKPNIIRDILKDNDHQVSGNEAMVYRFGNPDFMKPKEKKKRQRDERGLVAGTKKSYTFELTAKGYDLERVTRRVLKKFPDANAKSISLWYRKAKRGVK